MKPGSAYGFTLLELVAVVAIAAVVMGVSAPAMQRFYQSSQYHGAVNDVVTVLSAARYTAIRNGKAEDVAINPQTRKLTQGEAVKNLPESITLEVLGSGELNTDGAGVIRFYPDGGSSGGSVTLAHHNGMQVRVDVDWLLGRVELCSRDCVEQSL